jgi:hypothetical protein
MNNEIYGSSASVVHHPEPGYGFNEVALASMVENAMATGLEMPQLTSFPRDKSKLIAGPQTLCHELYYVYFIRPIMCLHCKYNDSFFFYCSVTHIKRLFLG